MPAAPPDGYQPVPVDAAASIARDYAKNAVVVLSFDREYGLIHTSTFGVSAEEKVMAAALGERLSAYVGCDLEKSLKFQDFRDVEKGEYVRRITELETLARDLAGDLGRALGDPPPVGLEWANLAKSARRHLDEAKEMFPDVDVNL